MKKFCSVILLLSILLSFSSCSGYMAVGMVRSNIGNTSTLTFSSLNGTININGTPAVVNADCDLHYEAELEEGELSVYYKIGGDEFLLFTIKGGEKLEGSGGYVSQGQRVTFVVKTVDTAKEGSIKIWA